ncbi:outer membrane transport energization protein ExbB [Singulisphaera sp. GP187]|uniref:MotA/TolQ/ExbB proton channel family protein n=1 Tax=Singulisphaera sp. GP187 TaxID=1882752 RepID=UPI00092BDFD6|nr:MotA/TolQ/ExbB proton channel family protein [Singulisphaera sp. GP187]SIO66302.1 outer membrane transport energization protein ExbB [Singulisphaera sp. GP187]
MSLLSNLLSWVSAGLLIPVLVVMTGLLGGSLLMLGDFLGAAIQRRRTEALTRSIAERLLHEPVRTVIAPDLVGAIEPIRTLRRCAEVGWHPIHADKAMADFELAARRGLDGPQALIRLGPMLGLMGTLIPIGPALAGLASGNIAAMAANVDEGLTATVVGLFVGGLGFWIRLVKQRWAGADLELLRYAYDLAQEQTEDRKFLMGVRPNGNATEPTIAGLAI